MECEGPEARFEREFRIDGEGAAAVAASELDELLCAAGNAEEVNQQLPDEPPVISDDDFLIDEGALTALEASEAECSQTYTIPDDENYEPSEGECATTQRSTRQVKVPFQQSNAAGSKARARVLLHNASDHPVKFKFHCSPPGILVAEEGGSGCVEAFQSDSRTFVWRREDSSVSWSGLEPPKLLLITGFADDVADSRQTATKLIGYFDDTEDDISQEQSLVSLILDTDEEPSEPEQCMQLKQASRARWHSGFGAAHYIVAGAFIGVIAVVMSRGRQS